MSESPTILVIGGPNGAGKSTLTAETLKHFPQIREFLNADSIARGLTGSSKNDAAQESGRILLNRMESLATKGVSFGVESTLSGRSLGANLKRYKAQGYIIELVYVTLDAPELSRNRVVQRVSLGGHDIPIEDIQRRFLKSHRNFWTIYRPLADNWRVYDNSNPVDPYVRLANGSSEHWIDVSDLNGWQRFLTKAGVV
jgi:predicted ABC-type ATPase